MRFPGSQRVPGSVLGVQRGGEGRKAVPGGCSASWEARGSGFTRQALSPSPAEPGPGAQPAALRSQPGTWLSVSRPRRASPAGYRPEIPEETCAAHPSSPLEPPSAYRSPPRLRPLRRRLRSLQSPLPTPLTLGRPGSRPPPSRALRAPAAPWVLVGSAPRDALLQPRATLLRAGPARASRCGRKGWREGRGGRRGSVEEQRKPQRHQSPRRRG
ncbi:uncharacterized protein LOC108591067 [Callithrix jacchus]|uniref:uncharacterized protein LOC108591067 n=1 Tax=Callithrix jacchus TaxID=9483 RepID=UPI00159F652E|nr:uncharacterized protein LOC108591067 [Callithrix jacchus]